MRTPVPLRKRSVHPCHAYLCEDEVPPSRLMCGHHWAMVPKALQRALWAMYVPGQERTKSPTREYLDAARACINAVREREGR